MSGIIGTSPNLNTGLVGFSGGSGFTTVAKVNIAAMTPAYNDIISVHVNADSYYKVILNGINDASGTNGNAMYIRASADGGSSWLTADWSVEFTYGSSGAAQNSGRWNMHSAANSTGIGLDHNHMTGVGMSGEFNVCTNATSSGQVKGFGHTVYDSDNQGDWGNSHFGGHWNYSNLASINMIRIVTNSSGLTPDSGFITVLKLV